MIKMKKLLPRWRIKARSAYSKSKKIETNAHVLTLKAWAKTRHDRQRWKENTPTVQARQQTLKRHHSSSDGE